MDFLVNIDTQLFYFLNKTLANPVSDAFFPFITKLENWYMLIIFGLIWALLKDGARGRFFVVALIIGILISDQTSSNLIKHAVERLRPCKTLEDINLLINCGSGFSFTSSHATNSFAAAAVITSFYKKYTWAFFTTAALIAYSRVVCGVHYPADIIVGSVLGLALGYMWASVFKYFVMKTKFGSSVYSEKADNPVISSE